MLAPSAVLHTNTAKSATVLPSPIPGRIVTVNAYTALDLLDGRAEAHDFEEEDAPP